MILIGTKYKILLQMLLLSLTVYFEEAQPIPSDDDYSGEYFMFFKQYATLSKGR